MMTGTDPIPGTDKIDNETDHGNTPEESLCHPRDLEDIETLDDEALVQLIGGLVDSFYQAQVENSYGYLGPERAANYLSSHSGGARGIMTDAKTLALHTIFGSLHPKSVNPDGSYFAPKDLVHTGAELGNSIDRDLINELRWELAANPELGKNPRFLERTNRLRDMPGIVGYYAEWSGDTAAGELYSAREQEAILAEEAEPGSKIDTIRLQHSLEHHWEQYELNIRELAAAIEDRTQRGVGHRVKPLAVDEIDRVMRITHDYGN